MTPIPHAVLIAIESELWTEKDVHIWSDSIILQLKEPPYWIIEISASKTYQELKEAIYESFIDIDIIFDNTRIVESQIGQSYKKYLNNEYSFADFVASVSTHLDCCISNFPLTIDGWQQISSSAPLPPSLENEFRIHMKNNKILIEGLKKVPDRPEYFFPNETSGSSRNSPGIIS